MIRTGDVIKQARQLRKLTQQQLASKIASLARDSYSRAALSQVENGDTKDMKPANLFAACKILEIDPQAAVAGKLKWINAAIDLPVECFPASEETPSDQISTEEHELLGRIRCLTAKQRGEIFQRVQELLASNQDVVDEWKLRGASGSP